MLLRNKMGLEMMISKIGLLGLGFPKQGTPLRWKEVMGDKGGRQKGDKMHATDWAD